MGMLENSDIISFHDYNPIQGLQDHLANLPTGVPMVCSEYMSRTSGSTFDPILGLLAQKKIWAVNWGFAAGRTQTNYPWDSWNIEYTAEPNPWQHEVLYANGTPYS